MVLSPSPAALRQMERGSDHGTDPAAQEHTLVFDLSRYKITPIASEVR